MTWVRTAIRGLSEKREGFNPAILELVVRALARITGKADWWLESVQVNVSSPPA